VRATLAFLKSFLEVGMALHFVFQFNVQHMFGELLVATKGLGSMALVY
jgi:hypothetical protein